MLSSNRVLGALAAVVALVGMTGSASGTILLESKGWRITMPAWASDGSGVAIVEDPANPDVLMIEIMKTFRGSPDQFGGMPSIVTTFQQIAPDAQTASKIVINDESVLNSTTVPWADFHYSLVGLEYASFDRNATFPSDTGGSADQDFFTDQMSSHSWQLIQPDSGNPATWTEKLDLFNGAIGIGDSFSPGSRSGSLVIDVDKFTRDGQGADATFRLKEYPNVPEPTTMALLALGGLAALKRRRIRA